MLQVENGSFTRLVIFEGLKGLQKTFRCTTNKCKNFVLIQLSEMHEAGRVKKILFTITQNNAFPNKRSI